MQELLTCNKLSELACLTLYMMYEKLRGEESRWLVSAPLACARVAAGGNQLNVSSMSRSPAVRCVGVVSVVCLRAARYEYIKELDRQRGRGQQGAKSPLLWDAGQVEELLQGSPVAKEVGLRLKVFVRLVILCESLGCSKRCLLAF